MWREGGGGGGGGGILFKTKFRFLGWFWKREITYLIVYIVSTALAKIELRHVISNNVAF